MGMTAKDLEFQCAFVEVFQLQKAPHQECLDKINDWLSNFHKTNEGYFDKNNIIDKFLEHYKAIKEYGLMTEIQMAMKNNYDFFSACRDWDV